MAVFKFGGQVRKEQKIIRRMKRIREKHEKLLESRKIIEMDRGALPKIVEKKKK